MSGSPAKPNPVARALRLTALGWLISFTVWAVLAIAVRRTPGVLWPAMLALNAMMAVAWTGFSVVVARWHLFLRRTRCRAALIVAAHLPLLALVAVADALLIRALSVAMS